ncbi:MAG: Clas25 [Betabaculovirus sp.]|nr:MAG: Clas25 [Betabaculovirus sp.]
MLYFKCEYDDLCKFDWSVLLSKDTLQLWLDVSCLRSKGFHVTDQCISSPVNIHNVIQYEMDDNECVVALESVDLTNENYEFCTTNYLLKINSTNDYYVTVLHQFLYHQLPKHLQKYLSHIHLMSLYDIKDYWYAVHSFDTIRKYWLFRWRVMCVMYENVLSNTTKNENELNDNNSLVPMESNELKLISSNSSNEEIVKILNNNIRQQFVYTNECVDTNKLYIMYNFNKMLMGSVGLLEVMVNWV